MHPSMNLSLENTPGMDLFYALHRDFLGGTPDGGSFPLLLLWFRLQSGVGARRQVFVVSLSFRLRPKRNGWQASPPPIPAGLFLAGFLLTPIEESEASIRTCLFHHGLAIERVP
jgi:hypothetical protein